MEWKRSTWTTVHAHLASTRTNLRLSIDFMVFSNSCLWRQNVNPDRVLRTLWQPKFAELACHIDGNSNANDVIIIIWLDGDVLGSDRFHIPNTIWSTKAKACGEILYREINGWWHKLLKIWSCGGYKKAKMNPSHLWLSHKPKLLININRKEREQEIINHFHTWYSTLQL